MANICISSRARELLALLVAAHRRSLLAYEHDLDQRGTHALVAARALLTLAVNGDDAPIYAHLDAYADNATFLGSFLRALSAAAEENPERASTARRLWPAIVEHVLAMSEAGHAPFDDRYHGESTLASLLPNAAGEVSYLYRELHGDPIAWWTPVTWRHAVDKWLPIAEGHPPCVDNLINFLAALTPTDQVLIGLKWVASLVLPAPNLIANRTFLLSSWLIQIRTATTSAGALTQWQRIVDALVVAGESRLAAYSE